MKKELEHFSSEQIERQDISVVDAFLIFLEDKIEQDTLGQFLSLSKIADLTSLIPKYNNAVFHDIVNLVSDYFNWPLHLVISEFVDYYQNCLR